VDGVDLTVHAGDIYGFLGPDGGSARLFGRDPQHELPDALDGVGGFVETPRFYPYLTGRKNLELFAAFDGGEERGRIAELLELVELNERAGDKVGGYSQGMRQRLGLAVSLLRNPRLLILDEPTNGLDPAGIRDMRNLIIRLAEQGMTVFLSSHLLAEVEELCTRVAVINRGRIVYEGALDELHASVAPVYRLRATEPERAQAVCSRDERVRDLTLDGDELVFSADEATVVELSKRLIEAGLGIAALVPETATLEALFFQLTESAA